MCSQLIHICPTDIMMIVILPENRPKDCQVLYNTGNKCSGVYEIHIGPFRKPVNVYCDMNNDTKKGCMVRETHLKVIYHSLYNMNTFVTNKSKLPQDGVQVFPYMGDWLSCDHLRGSHDSHMITPYKDIIIHSI